MAEIALLFTCSRDIISDTTMGSSSVLWLLWRAAPRLSAGNSLGRLEMCITVPVFDEEEEDEVDGSAALGTGFAFRIALAETFL